jgi:cell division protein FtsW (lipid II flippase)
MKKNKNIQYIVSYDKVILICYLSLCLIGILMMLDITSMQSMDMFYRHLIYFFISIAFLGIIFYFIDLEKLRPLNILWIFISITLLILVLMYGTTVKGGRRSIKFGPLSIQPSFIARLALIFFYAGFLAKKQDKINATNLLELLKELAPLIVYTMIIFVLIYLEKHLSTLIICGATLLGMLYYAGVRKRFIISLVAIGLIAGIVIINKGDSFRSARIETYKVYSLFNPNRPDPENSPDEYQVRESLTALTSGHIIGTGIARGRAKHNFLPEARTDYVYSIIGEEFGLIGALIVLGLHALLFFRILKIGSEQESLYYKYLCAGIALNIFLNVLLNTGVAMSLLPPTGNTLPFISYGGTALLSDSISIGVVLNISAKRRQL